MSDAPIQAGGRDEQSLLRARARALAQRRQPARDEPGLELLEFRIAGQSFAVETRHLAEVAPLQDLTPVPGAPSFFAGIVNLRGLVTAVLDLTAFLDLPAPGPCDQKHLVLVRAGGLDLGLLAQQVVGVRACALSALQPVPAGLAGHRPELVRGLAGDGALVLDVERLFADPRLVAPGDSSPLSQQEAELP